MKQRVSWPWLLAVAIGIGLAPPAFAQIRAGGLINTQTARQNYAAVLTLTSQGAATVTSNPITLGAGANLSCYYAQTSHTGTPSVTWAIQGQVPTTTNYYSIITSAAVTADSTSILSIGTGILPSANLGANQVVPPVIRLSVTVAGTSPVVNAAVFCDGSE